MKPRRLVTSPLIVDVLPKPRVYRPTNPLLLCSRESASEPNGPGNSRFVTVSLVANRPIVLSPVRPVNLAPKSGSATVRVNTA